MRQSFAESVVAMTANFNVTKVVGAKKNLAALCSDIFLIVIRMREAEDIGDPASLRKLIMHYIALFESNCRALKIADKSIDIAKYALVALLDETVLSIPGECRDFWISQPLQLDYFGDTLAGRVFYGKLDNLLSESNSAVDVLEVFFLCMSLGFEGKYKVVEPSHREVVLVKICTRIAQSRTQAGDVLSPHGRNNEKKTIRSRKFRLEMVPAVAIYAASAMFITWLTLYIVNKIAFHKIISIVQP
jgi:type VI secretion system protein ImpK